MPKIDLDILLRPLGLKRERYRNSQVFWFARTTAIYSSLGFCVAMGYTLFYSAIGAMRAAFSLGMLGLVLIATIPLFSLGRSRAAAKINLAATSFAMAGVVAHTGGINSSAACWLLGVTPAITALLFRRPLEILQLTGLTIALYFGIFSLEFNGYEVHQLGFDVGTLFERIYTFAHFTFFAMFIATALSIFAMTQKRLYDDLQQNKFKLETTTSNMVAIFSSIHGAVFLVNTDFQISAERSDRFKDILGDGIQTLSDIFEACDLSADKKAWTMEAISICMGQDAINFMVNEHLLPAELHYQRAGSAHSQTLSCHWSPVFKDEIVRDILVEIRDVTNLMEAKEKEKQSTYRNSMLLALLQTKGNIMKKFVGDLERQEQRLIDSWSKTPRDDQHFKAIVHTVKGNARSFKLWDMAETAHHVETLFAKKYSAEQQAEIQGQFQLLLTRMQEFRQIHQEIMSRNTAQQDAVSINNSELENLVRVLEKIPSERPLLSALRTRLPNSLGSLAAHLEQDLLALAEDLGKTVPLLKINDPGFVFPEESHAVIVDAVGHMIRNCVDHGIESDAIRKNAGKAAQGVIRIDAYQTEEHYLMRIQDDGAGLNLRRIREKASEKGIPVLNDEEAAAVIFRDDFSTADRISLISGRGVGMSSAWRDLRHLQGNISIEFLGPEVLGYRPFRFCISWPVFAQGHKPLPLAR